MDDSSQKFSLSFSKVIIKKNLQTSALRQETSQVSEPNLQAISSFDKDAKLAEPIKLEDNLVIPMVQTNRDVLFKNLLKKSSKENKEKTFEFKELKNQELSLDEKAALALIEESSKKLEEIKSRASDEIYIQNSSPSSLSFSEIGQEGKVSTLEDYEQINVESFGSAMLRGMGWNKDKGIGKNKKRVIEIIDPSNKGFALSSTESKKKLEKSYRENKEEVREEEGEEELKKGSYVLIYGGRNRGLYGIAESVDEDHVLVRTAREDKVLREVELNIRVVSTKEYKDLSRVINKEMYDEYKAAELKKKKDKKKEKEDKEFLEDLKRGKRNDGSKIKENRKHKEIVNKKINQNKSKDLERSDEKKYSAPNLRSTETSKIEDNYLKEKLKQIKEQKRHRHNKDKYDDYEFKSYRSEREKNNECEEIFNENGDKYNKKSNEYERRHNKFNQDKTKKEKYESIGKRIEKKSEKYSSYISKTQSPASVIMPWARENLKVRIIDKKYKDGRYHKAKVIVCSMDTMESCTCRSHEGKILYDVNPNNLETVIPKIPSAIVLIVKGKYKGQKARILELHKEQEKATLQLLEEGSIILQLYYEDICEYVSL